MWTLCVRAAHILAFPSRSLHRKAESCQRTAETWEGFLAPPNVLGQNQSLLFFLWETSIPDMSWVFNASCFFSCFSIWKAYIYTYMCKRLQDLVFEGLDPKPGLWMVSKLRRSHTRFLDIHEDVLLPSKLMDEVYVTSARRFRATLWYTFAKRACGIFPFFPAVCLV